jgi:hypothetical protein
MKYNAFVDEILDEQEYKDNLEKISQDPEIYLHDIGYKKSFRTAVILAWTIPMVVALGLFIWMVLDATVRMYCYIPFIVAAIISTIITIDRINNHRTFLIASMGPRIVSTVYGQDAIFDDSVGFSEDFLKTIDAFPVKTIKQEDFISGHFKGIECKCADVTSSHIESAKGYKETSIDFSGSIYLIKLNKTVENRISIFRAIDLISFKEVPFKNKKLDFYYNIYCSNNDYALNFVNETMQSNLIDIAKSLRGIKFTIYLENNYAVVIIPDYETSFSVIPGKSLRYNVNTIVHDVSVMAYFATSLNV